MKLRLTTALCVITLIFLQGCGSKENGDVGVDLRVDAKDQALYNDDINWFSGSVDEAFAFAKQEEKPLFFYWGAEWCPPCQEIKHTIFIHPKFVSQSQLFVPVYLDGDTEQAQLVGERFSVQGYPTMIVFNSNGEELTRIPGGIDTRRYLDVLSMSMNQGKNMDALISLAQENPQSLSSDELVQLAYYSWGQGNLSISDEEVLRLLKTLSNLDREEDQLALSRLLFAYLSMQVDLGVDELSAQEKIVTADRISELLSDPDQVLGNVDFLSFYAGEIVQLLNLEPSKSDALVLKWVNNLDPQTRNPLLSKAEHLGKWLAPVSFYWLQYPEAENLPEDLQIAISKEVQNMDEETKGEERQSVINRAGNLLRAANMYPQAKTLITKEIAVSKSPYYFMSSLAEIAEETDDPTGVIEWRKKAYESAAGKATRFQWGVEYATALIEYQPENAELISSTAMSLVDNLDNGSDVFTGRNYGRLKTLLSALNEWKSDQQEEITQKFVKQLDTYCQQENQISQQCHSLLAES